MVTYERRPFGPGEAVGPTTTPHPPWGQYAIRALQRKDLHSRPQNVTLATESALIECRVEETEPSLQRGVDTSGLGGRLAGAPIPWGVCEVVRLLDDAGYERWLVLEQDLAITGSEPPVDGGPALDVRKSIEFLSTRAPRREVSHS